MVGGYTCRGSSQVRQGGELGPSSWPRGASASERETAGAELSSGSRAIRLAAHDGPPLSRMGTAGPVIVSSLDDPQDDFGQT